jgi:Putative DNA-binding domain
VAQIARRLREALDVERVTKRFYDDFQRLHESFLGFIEGIETERDRRWYASVLLNRLMFVYFLQKKSLLDRADTAYLRNKLEASRRQGPDLYYSGFLRVLFFDGFGRPVDERRAEVRQLLGEICYLDGGLFLPHKVEIGHPDIHIPDAAFEEVFDLFERYSWNLDDTPGGDDNEINPDVLGYIFERYINQKQFGAYYTRPEITRYLCEKAIHPLILERVNAVASGKPFDSIEEMLLRLDASLCRRLWFEILPSLSILDPACGSGAFLVAALKTLITVYAVVLGKAKLSNDSNLRRELSRIDREHPSAYYWIKKRIITDNLFGVDVMEEATEIAKLRLFLTLVASANHVEELEPLPNIDFNILPGNSLIGLLQVKEEDFDNRTLFRRSFREVLAAKNRLIDAYRHAGSYAEKLQSIRDEIEEEKRKAGESLDDILLEQFKALGIRYEEATWDEKAKKEGKSKRRPLKIDDLEALHPLHWAYEFDQVLAAGGFDVILTNPPWEVFKPQAKEFFAEYSDVVTKNKMTIKDFEKEQGRLLKDKEVRTAWLAYQGRFPHVSLFFRSSVDYANQISVVNGKKAGSDINLYKLFVERCFRLLRPGGRCGILIPTGIYQDLGAKRLREMLFSEARIDSLYGLSNEKYIFEGVHHSFRICLLVFEKGGTTEDLKVAFRINPREAIAPEGLDSFLSEESAHLTISRELIERLSPDSLTILELKDRDVDIVDKMFRQPLLKDRSGDFWPVTFKTEFHMTGDSRLFKDVPVEGRLPLYEGKMIHQFTAERGQPKYWIDETEARRALLGSGEDRGQLLDYQRYRLGFRDVARNTDERTMIMTVLPRYIFCNHPLPTAVVAAEAGDGIDLPKSLLLCGLMNSFSVDYLFRLRVTTHLTYFILYQTPVPQLSRRDVHFLAIVERSARLICTTEEFADLWQEVTGTAWTPEAGAEEAEERARLRAEIDGLVAHLYGLTEEEFAHILSTFPVVRADVKSAALAAYRAFAPKPGDPAILAFLAQGESAQLEFKSTARWDLKEQRKNPVLEGVILHTVTAFLNAEGGTLLIGVADDGTIIGLSPDYQTLKKKNRDSFELFLTDLLLNAVGKDLAGVIRTTFHDMDGKDVCKVVVAASPRPVFLKEGNEELFWLRTGNSTRKLTVKEAVQYCKMHWS